MLIIKILKKYYTKKYREKSKQYWKTVGFIEFELTLIILMIIIYFL